MVSKVRTNRNRGGGATVVVGGAGAVGGHVARILSRQGGAGQLLLVGRSAAAERLAATLPRARDARLNLHEPQTWEPVLARAGAVIIAVDAPPAFAGACVDRGLVVVDVSAAPGQVGALAELDKTARTTGARGRYAVGLAPGVLTAAALDLIQGLPATPHTLRLTVELHLLDEYGPDALKWTAQAVHPPGHLPLPGLDAAHAAFADVDLLTADLPGLHVEAFVRLLPRPAGLVLRAHAQWPPLQKLAQRTGAPNVLTTLLQPLPREPRPFRLTVEATAANSRQSRTVTGHGQALTTAAAACTALQQAQTSQPGMQPLHRTLSFPDLSSDLRRRGATLTVTDRETTPPGGSRRPANEETP